MTTGLVLGKFAPLHKGHQLLIETAIKENGHVVVLIYHSPEQTNVPLPIRSQWIRSLYPDVEVIEAWDGPMEIGDTPDIKQMHEEYLLKILDGRKITRFYSSEFYGEHVSKALNAKDRRIDEARSIIPVSGTVIRKNPFPNRGFLDPIVYRDLITKVVFLGAPSTGKTTLASRMASVYQTNWMPEYGREYWEEHQIERRLTLEQLVEIAEGHQQREEELFLNANGVVFIDTDATTTSNFSAYYHGEVHPRLASMASKTLRRYDLFFLCDTDIPYDDTWDRSGDTNRLVFQEQIKADLIQRKIPFITLKGPLEDRIKKVRTVLESYRHYQSFGDCVKW